MAVICTPRSCVEHLRGRPARRRSQYRAYKALARRLNRPCMRSSGSRYNSLLDNKLGVYGRSTLALLIEASHAQSCRFAKCKRLRINRRRWPGVASVERVTQRPPVVQWTIERDVDRSLESAALGLDHRYVTTRPIEAIVQVDSGVGVHIRVDGNCRRHHLDPRILRQDERVGAVGQVDAVAKQVAELVREIVAVRGALVVSIPCHGVSVDIAGLEVDNRQGPVVCQFWLLAATNARVPLAHEAVPSTDDNRRLVAVDSELPLDIAPRRSRQQIKTSMASTR